MKFVLFLSMGLLLVGRVQAQKNPVCTKKPQANGQCPEKHSGFTYIVDHGCEEYYAFGCHIIGNFFHTHEDCDAKCSSSWEARLQDFYLRGMHVIGRFVTELMSHVRRLV